MNQDISVLMSTYKNDNPTYLKKSIDSMINQTMKPKEMVIVIDGSIPERNNNLLKEYKLRYNFIKLIYLEKNQGLGLALKRGVEECKSPYIARMDSDDISRKDRLEIEFKALIKQNVDIVGSNITEFIDDENNIISRRVVPEKDEDIKKYIKNRCPMNHVTVMFKKDSITRVDNYEEWPYNEDYILWIKMFENHCTFYNIQDDLVNVRVGKDMYRRRGGRVYFESEKKIQKYMLKKKIINYPTYLSNVLKRFILQILLTNNMRQFVFKYFARKALGGNNEK